MTHVAISVCADDMNISVRSGSIDIAVRKLKLLEAFRTMVPEMQNKY
jgi:hypothetical protein